MFVPVAGVAVAEAEAEDEVMGEVGKRAATVVKLDAVDTSCVVALDVVVLDAVDGVVAPLATVVLLVTALPPSISTVATLTPALLSWAGDALSLLAG